MKRTFLFLICIIILGCASQKTKDISKNYEIVNSVNLTLNTTDSINVNELRFTPNFGPSDLQSFLFKKYGRWDDSIQTDRKLPLLV